ISPYSIQDHVQKYHANTSEMHIQPANPSDEQIQEAVEMAKQQDVLLVGTQSASQYSGQVKLVRALEKLGKPIVVVAFRNPYDIQDFPQVDAYLNAYG